MSKFEVEYYAHYILDNKFTIREAAKKLNIPKSTLHYKVTKKLKEENFSLFLTLHSYLQSNFDEKHIRGGMATKTMWEKRKKIKRN